VIAASKPLCSVCSMHACISWHAASRHWDSSCLRVKTATWSPTTLWTCAHAVQTAFFEPDLVYTFHIAQHTVDVVNYKLAVPALPILNHSLLGHLAGQPLRFMAINRLSKGHYWNLEVRHCQLLLAPRRARLVHALGTCLCFPKGTVAIFVWPHSRPAVKCSSSPPHVVRLSLHSSD
jgi:hypothetical protein